MSSATHLHPMLSGSRRLALGAFHLAADAALRAQIPLERLRIVAVNAPFYLHEIGT